MKTNWIIGTLGVLLFASLASNAWLGATLKTYRYNVSQGWFTYSFQGAPEYPIIGLPSSDLKQMLDQIDASDEQRSEDKYVLMVEVLDLNTVEITTGRQDGPLSGGGRIFHFNRKTTGWELDIKRHGGWLS